MELYLRSNVFLSVRSLLLLGRHNVGVGVNRSSRAITVDGVSKSRLVESEMQSLRRIRRPAAGELGCRSVDCCRGSEEERCELHLEQWNECDM